MEFGKIYRVGNYVVVKKSRSLSKSEVRQLRSQQDIPAEVQKSLQRHSLPFIAVQSISGIWSVCFMCGMTMFLLLDKSLPRAIEQDREPQDGFDGMTVADFIHLFNMWYMDTCIVGDSLYQQDKGRAFKAMMDRQVAAELSQDEDDRILAEVKADEDAKAAIADGVAMVSQLTKEEEGALQPDDREEGGVHAGE